MSILYITDDKDEMSTQPAFITRRRRRCRGKDIYAYMSDLACHVYFLHDQRDAITYYHKIYYYFRYYRPVAILLL